MKKRLLKKTVLAMFLFLLASCVSGQIAEPDTPAASITSTESAEETPNIYPTRTLGQPTQTLFSLPSSPLGDLFFSADGKVLRIHLQNGEVEMFTTQEANYISPTIATNGFLYFLSDLNSARGMMEVYRMDINNGSLQRFTYDDFYEYPLAVSSDGTRIAYVSDQHELVDRGYVISYINIYDNSGVQEIYRTSQWIRNLVWSPDGKKLIFFTQTDLDSLGNNLYLGNLYLADIETRSVIQISINRMLISSSPVWSPDGTSVVISISEDPNTNSVNLYSLNLTTLELTALTDIVGQAMRPSYSPDGNTILFEITNAGDIQLCMLSTRDGSVEMIMDAPWNDGFFHYDAIWAPEGSYIAYVQKLDQQHEGIVISSVDGSFYQLLTLDNQYYNISDISWMSP